jgi:hypothetical protein
MNLVQPSPALLQLMCSLETGLHSPAVRADKAQLEKLLHADFFEIGRSGTSYRRADIIKQLVGQKGDAVIWSQDFALSMPAYSVALLVYKSAHINAQGELTMHAQRSSMWQYDDLGWQMRFHQGTPTAAFTKNETTAASKLCEVS